MKQSFNTEEELLGATKLASRLQEHKIDFDERYGLPQIRSLLEQSGFAPWNAFGIIPDVIDLPKQESGDSADKILLSLERSRLLLDESKILAQYGVQIGFEIETILSKEQKWLLFYLAKTYPEIGSFSFLESEIISAPNSNNIVSIADWITLQKIMREYKLPSIMPRSLHTTLGGVELKPDDTRIMLLELIETLCGDHGLKNINPQYKFIFEDFIKLSTFGDTQFYFPGHKIRSRQELTPPQETGVELRLHNPPISLLSAYRYTRHALGFGIGLRALQTSNNMALALITEEYVAKIKDLTESSGLINSYNQYTGLKSYKGEIDHLVSAVRVNYPVGTKFATLPEDEYKTLITSLIYSPYSHLLACAVNISADLGIAQKAQNLRRRFISSIFHEINNQSNQDTEI